ncbi:MAG: proline dehydrogenase family protein [Chloroflexota bacterium]
MIQAYLYRSEPDVRTLIRLGARVRLCKGAYAEPPSVAYSQKVDVDRNFVRLMELLLLRAPYPAIATHDERIIDHARRFAAHWGIRRHQFEFQMLFGVRRDLQASLVRDGYRVRVYVPFGSAWYPYLTRRLAERPANLFFVLGSLAREAIAGSG